MTAGDLSIHLFKPKMPSFVNFRVLSGQSILRGTTGTPEPTFEDESEAV
jgi:AMMECR1 domain-containing protein